MSFDYTLPCLLLSRDSLETICASRILHPFQVSTWNPFQGARRASAASVSVGLVWAPGKNMKNIVFGIDGHHLAMDQRWSKSCHGTIFFWSWRVKTTCYQKLIIMVFSHHDQKIWFFWLSRICIYIYYDSIYDATLHAPFSDPDGLPKKDPKSAVPTQAKAAWMPRRDEITQWSSHDENRGIWPSTMGGFSVQPWKIRI